MPSPHRGNAALVAILSCLLCALTAADPTLTLVDTLILGNEDQDIIISYTALQAAADEADVDGGTVDFTVTSLTSGTLGIRDAGSSGAGTTAINQTFDATKELVWHPAADQNGPLGAFLIRARDLQGNDSATDVPTIIDVAAIPDPPTLTTVGSLVLGSEDQDIVISHADLLGAADAADADGGTINFTVTSLTTGTLGIRAAGGSGAGSAAINQTFDATKELVWRPAADQNGLLNAFLIKARDPQGNDSASPVQTSIDVAASPDVPTLTTVDTLTLGSEDQDIVISYSALLAAANAGDADGGAVNFTVTSLASGTLGLRPAGDSGAGTTAISQTLDATKELVWHPAADQNGALPAFQIKARDPQGNDSATAVQTIIDVAAVNDPVVVVPASHAVDYSMITSGYVAVVSPTIACSDPADGTPTMSSGVLRLTITSATTANGTSGEDILVVRQTTACRLLGSASPYTITRRATGKILATATIANDILTITADAAWAANGDGVTTALNAQDTIEALLGTIYYSNIAGTLASDTASIRTVTTTIAEAVATPITTVLTCGIRPLIDNDPPVIRFAAAKATPNGSAALEPLRDADDGTVQWSDATALDEFTVTVLTAPASGYLYDSSTDQRFAKDSVFPSSRFSPLSASAASIIRYKSESANAQDDLIELRFTDKGTPALSTDVTIVVQIGIGSDTPVFVSDPLPWAVRGQPTTHTLILNGPGSVPLTLAVEGFLGEPPPDGSVVGLSAASVTTDVNGNADAVLTVTPPATGNYLVFMLTSSAGSTVGRQPFVIRLSPTVAEAPAAPGASN